jgi:hypothetical protein
VFPASAPVPATNGHRPQSDLSDSDVLRIGTAESTDKFSPLFYDGDTSAYGGDDSAADLALCQKLVFYTRDSAQIDRLFRGSKLYREKWDAKRGTSTYGRNTIIKALQQQTEHYEPAGGWATLTAGTGKTGNQRIDTTDRSTSVSGVSGAITGNTQSESWPERESLPAEIPSVSTLPPEMVPAPLREWISDIADLVKLPLEMVAVPAIVAAGSVIGRSVGIRPGVYDDFTVVPNLWGGVVARPGWMKTNAIDEALKPLRGLAHTAHEQFKEREAEFEATKERIEAEIDALKSKMREAAKKDESLVELEKKMKAKKAELKQATPKETRYLTHDATVEKLGELLRDNPRGLLVLRDELSGWLRTLEKAGHEGDREFFLESWNGTGSFVSDRIGRGTIHIPALTLAIFGGIQPGKLRPLIDGALDGGIGDDGLPQRLQLLVYLDHLPPWQKAERFTKSEPRKRAHTIFAGLDRLAIGSSGDAGDIPYMRFSSDAQTVFDDWHDALEHRLRGETLDETPAFAAHLAKYRSLVPALALIFHCLDVAAKSAGVIADRVDETNVRLAAAWADFLEEHARKMYAAEINTGVAAAHALAKKIEDGGIADGESIRDIYRNQWSGLRKPDRVDAAINVLIEHNWVRTDAVTKGGRTSRIVWIHPDFSKGNGNA